MIENIQKVRELLDKPELLCQLAEECQELGEAALKLRRAMTGTNPTPMTETDAWRNLNIEVADLMNSLAVLGIPMDDALVQGIQQDKMKRWVRRLEERKA